MTVRAVQFCLPAIAASSASWYRSTEGAYRRERRRQQRESAVDTTIDAENSDDEPDEG